MPYAWIPGRLKRKNETYLKLMLPVNDTLSELTPAMRDGYDYDLTHIPPEFKEEPKDRFDPVYMKKLFDVGYKLARAGYLWQKVPPRLQKYERG